MTEPRQRLDVISPSQLARLRACELEVALDLQFEGEGSRDSPAAALGRAAHLALEDLVRAGQIRSKGSLAPESSAAWARATAQVFGPAPAAAVIPGFRLKEARLPGTARRLRAILADAETLEPEADLVSRDGRIRGRADLIATGPRGILIVDYKSRVERDPATGALILDQFSRQLQLYAWLIHDMRDVWPASAHVLAFDADPIQIDVASATCNATAEDAIARLDAFNDDTREPSASPGPHTCRFCGHLLRCGAFSSASGPEWADELLVAIGRVESVETAQNGTTALEIDVFAGSIAPGRIAVTRLTTAAHPALALAEAGRAIAVSGLHPSPSLASYTLRDSGTIRVANDS